MTLTQVARSHARVEAAKKKLTDARIKHQQVVKESLGKHTAIEVAKTLGVSRQEVYAMLNRTYGRSS